MGLLHEPIPFDQMVIFIVPKSDSHCALWCFEQWPLFGLSFIFPYNVINATILSVAISVHIFNSISSFKIEVQIDPRNLAAFDSEIDHSSKSTVSTQGP